MASLAAAVDLWVALLVVASWGALIRGSSIDSFSIPPSKDILFLADSDMVSIVCFVITVSPARDDTLCDIAADEAATAGDNATRDVPGAPLLPMVSFFPSQNPGSNASSLSVLSASSEFGDIFGSKLSDVFVIDRSRIASTDDEADCEGMAVIPDSDRPAESGADFFRGRVSDGVRIFFLAKVDVMWGGTSNDS